MARPIEHKVTAGVAGAGAGGIVGDFVLWLLERYAFHAPAPERVSSFVLLAVPAALAGAAGWLAPHTARAVEAVEDEADELGVSVSLPDDFAERVEIAVERVIAARFPAPELPEPETGDEAPAADAPAAADDSATPTWHTTFPTTGTDAP